MQVENLNTAQKEAAEYLHGPMLVLAGAGAGKTKTITARIVQLIRSGVAPKNILAITFTNKAAREMKERVEIAIKEDALLSSPVTIQEMPFVSTFHALGVHIIKENAHLLGLTRFFAIYDKSDSKQAIKDALKKLDYDPKQFDVGKIQNIISREKGNATPREIYEERVAGDYIGGVVAEVWAEYELTLHREKALDFDDLLVKALGLLHNPEILEHYQNTWQYIHVDEYQDTNKVQYQITQLLSSKKQNICVVGDIDQNIYSWRGAQLRNILEFEKDFPSAKVVLLEENYRSTQTILEVANYVIKKNKFRKEKNLYTKNPTGEPISIFEGYDEMSEAEFVATKASALIESGCEPQNIAVLYRANFQSRSLEEAFLSYGVCYQLVGTKFFERREVKDVLSYIRASLSPESLADIKRIINVPSRGIGKVSLLKIFEGKADSLPTKVRGEYKHFVELLQKIRVRVSMDKPSELIKYVISETGIEEELKQESDGEERLENIRELVTLATRYDDTPGEAGVERMLTDVSLQSDQDELEKKQNGVKLMTVHASKGLEFDYVFITGLEENLFPHKRMEEREIANEDDEEERRLFYVALTRARKKIFLSYAQIRTIFGSKQITIPSEFVLDIPEEYTMREEGNYGLLRKPLFSIDF
jgi:DNA helicase-2/ATP-dependent DNA helicase PcrA